jgi:transcription antitermination factor NusG
MSKEIDRPWCVVMTKRGKEGDVQVALAQAGWATYQPMQTCWARPSRLRKRVRKPLFPRYLFAACTPEGDIAAPAEIDGVKVHRSATGRSVVCLSLLARMMLTDANHGFDLTYELPKPVYKTLLRGEQVRIADGVLKGFNAKIEKVLNAREVIATYVLYGRAGMATFRKSDLETFEQAA